MKNLFKNIGLSESEAAAYEVLLEKGELSPPEVSALLNLGRQNAYAVLKSLEERGLAKKDVRHNKIHYLPESPENLSELCEKKIIELEKRKASLENKMPQLMSFYNLAKDRPGISVFKGIDGIKTLYEDTLRRKPKEILLILSAQGKGTYLSAWLTRHYRPLRIKNKIFLREIITTKENHKTKELEALLWKKKYTPLPGLPQNIDILLYDDNVTFIKYDKKEPVGFTIDDKLVFAALKVFFEMVWQF